MRKRYFLTVLASFALLMMVIPSSKAQAPADFPIGLELEFIGDFWLGSPPATTFTFDYEILEWSSFGTNIVEARGRGGILSMDWQTVYFHTLTWRIYDSSGNPTSNYVFPPIWISLLDLTNNSILEVHGPTGTTVEFTMTAFHSVTVASGIYTCWKAEAMFSDIFGTWDFEAYYENQIGLVVQWEYTITSGIPSGNQYQFMELSESNHASFIPPPPIPGFPWFAIPIGLVIGIGVTMRRRYRK